MAVNYHLDLNAGGNNINGALSGLENDPNTGRAHVCLVLSVPCASNFDRIFYEPLLRVECQEITIYGPVDGQACVDLPALKMRRSIRTCYCVSIILIKND